MCRVRLAGRTFVVLLFLVGGLARFIAAKTEVRLVPPYIPRPHAGVAASGIFEPMGAGGLLFVATRRASGRGWH